MKSMLFVGAALMVSATIYGFVDLRTSKNSKELRSLYRDQPSESRTETITITPRETDLNVGSEKKEISKKAELSGAKTGRKKTRKEINYKKFSRSALREEIVLDNPVTKKAEVTEKSELK